MKEAISIMTVMVMIMTVMVMMIRMRMNIKRVVMMMANRVTEMVMLIRLGPSLLVCKKVQLHNRVGLLGWYSASCGASYFCLDSEPDM